MNDLWDRRPWLEWSRLHGLRERMSVTLYGSYHPPPEMMLLERMRNFLRGEGYAQACFVRGAGTRAMGESSACLARGAIASVTKHDDSHMAISIHSTVSRPYFVLKCLEGGSPARPSSSYKCTNAACRAPPSPGRAILLSLQCPPGRQVHPPESAKCDPRASTSTAPAAPSRRQTRRRPPREHMSAPRACRAAGMPRRRPPHPAHMCHQARMCARHAPSQGLMVIRPRRVPHSCRPSSTR